MANHLFLGSFAGFTYFIPLVPQTGTRSSATTAAARSASVSKQCLALLISLVFPSRTFASFALKEGVGLNPDGELAKLMANFPRVGKVEWIGIRLERRAPLAPHAA